VRVLSGWCGSWAGGAGPGQVVRCAGSDPGVSPYALSCLKDRAASLPGTDWPLHPQISPLVSPCRVHLQRILGVSVRSEHKVEAP
jgi:hypothetical protein